MKNLKVILSLLCIVFLLTSCSKTNKPKGENQGDYGGEFLPGSDLDNDLGDFTEASADRVGLFAEIQNKEGSKTVPGGERITYEDKKKYQEGFTVNAVVADRYMRKGKVAGEGMIPSWYNTTTRFYDAKGKKIVAKAGNNQGDFLELTQETKNRILCSASKKVRVFISFTYKTGNPTPAEDAYVEAPPLTLIGDTPSSSTCSSLPPL